MLSKINRLAKKKDIESVYKRGRILANRFFRIKYLPNSFDFSRATVIVSKKVSRLAVRRNKIKRQVRPLLEKVIQNNKNNLDIMFMVQPQVIKLNQKEIKEQINLIIKELSSR